MLNVFTSFAAVNEAVTAANGIDVTRDIPEYNFEGLSLVEAIQECRNQIMTEAAHYDEFAVGSDELITEAAMSNPYAVEVLTESALDGILGKLKSLLDKLIAMVKGLIVKVKAWFAKFFGKTDTWCKLMEPKVKNAKPDPELEIQMWNWSQDAISSISTGAGKLFQLWKDGWSTKTFDSLKARAESIYSQHKNDENNDYDPTKEFEGVLGSSKTTGDLEDNLTKDMNSAFGTTGSNVADVRSQIVRKAHGDIDSKDVVKIAGQMNPMFDYVKGAKNVAKSIEKLYQDNLNELKNFRNSLNKTVAVKADDDAKNKGMSSSVKSAFKGAVDTVARYTSAYNSAISGMCQLQISLTQEMLKDYMNAVTKCVNSKAKTKK